MVPRPTKASLGRDDVTVVVPVRDRPAALDRLLGALDGLDCVVVDDASNQVEATRTVVERHGARLVSLGENIGPAGARNAGLAVADRRLVAFVDSDCEPTTGWLEPLLGHFDDPLVAAVAPRVVAAGSSSNALSRYETTRSQLDRGGRPGPVRPGGPVPFVPSAALVVRADLAAGSLLFDPALRGGEDVDLVWRLDEAGWEVRYVPSSTVRHHGAATLGAFLARQAFYGSTAAPLGRRHPNAVAPASLSAWTAAASVLALMRRPWLALAALVLSVGVVARRLSRLIRRPRATAVVVAAHGTERAALAALAGLARVWAPGLLLALVLGSRRTRRLATAGLVIPALADWVRLPPRLDPLRYGVLHVADDAAYGIGVWAGCVRVRSVRPLVPRMARPARLGTRRGA
jgi:mycofactocin system glycosyltransferase